MAEVAGINKAARPNRRFDSILEKQPVYDRVQPGFEVPGTRLGDVLLHPSAQLLEVFDDNIFATQNNKSDDLISVIAPKITATTFNPKRGFQAEASSQHGVYLQNGRENFNDYHMTLMPFVRVTQAAKLQGQVLWERNHEPRSSEASPTMIGAEEPVRWYRTIGRLGWEYKPGRLGFSSAVQHEDREFENVANRFGGPTFVNNDRDRTEDSLEGILSYDLTDQNQLYAQATAFNRDYRRRDFLLATNSYSGVRRDSIGSDLRGGTKINLTPLISLDANAGYYQQDFDDNTLKNVRTAVGSAKATWLVTKLTTVNINVTRDVFETVQQGASAFVQSKGGAAVTHELRRNVILGLEAETGTSNYVGSTRQDDFWGTGVSATYRLNRNMDVKADYLYDNRESNLALADFDRQRVFLSLQVKF